MGGYSSKSANRGGCCNPRERAFLLVSWDAAFLNRMMRTPTATAADLEDGQSSAASPLDISQVFAVAPPPVVDARRLLSLVEGSHNTQPPPTSRFPSGTGFTRWVRTRLVLFTPELSASLAQLHQNTRLWHIFRRRLYLPILGPRELQAQLVNRALHRFQRRSRRRGPGVIVLVAGDGSLEAIPSFATSLRAMLRWGHRLEIWSWDGVVPPLYKELASEVAEGRVQVRYLNDHRPAIRYQTGGRGSTGAAAGVGTGIRAAALGGGGSFPPTRPSNAAALPVAMPMAFPVEGGGGGGGGGVGGGGGEGEGRGTLAVARGPHHTVQVPLEKDDGGEADRSAAAVAGLKIGEDGEVAEGEGGVEGEEEDDTSSDDETDQQHRTGSAADAYDEDDDAPEPFLDPLTMEVMVDPALTPSGYSYERAVIVEQIRRRGVDPMTQQPLAEEDLRPNRALREMIELWRSRQRQQQQQQHPGGQAREEEEGEVEGEGESKGRG